MRVVLVSIIAIVESRKATLLIVREDALWLVHPHNPLVRLGSDAIQISHAYGHGLVRCRMVAPDAVGRFLSSFERRPYYPIFLVRFSCFHLCYGREDPLLACLEKRT